MKPKKYSWSIFELTEKAKKRLASVDFAVDESTVVGLNFLHLLQGTGVFALSLLLLFAVSTVFTPK